MRIHFAKSGGDNIGSGDVRMLLYEELACNSLLSFHFREFENRWSPYWEALINHVESTRNP